jgi:hypothetical protein
MLGERDDPEALSRMMPRAFDRRVLTAGPERHTAAQARFDRSPPQESGNLDGRSMDRRDRQAAVTEL